MLRCSLCTVPFTHLKYWTHYSVWLWLYWSICAFILTTYLRIFLLCHNFFRMRFFCLTSPIPSLLWSYAITTLIRLMSLTDYLVLDIFKWCSAWWFFSCNITKDSSLLYWISIFYLCLVWLKLKYMHLSDYIDHICVVRHLVYFHYF